MTPSWTDIIQAIAAIIAVPGAIAAFVILFKKDKARESEIKSLATIASQLTSMQQENEKRHKTSKKPHLSISLEADFTKKFIRLDFKNNNTNTTIEGFNLIYSDLKIYNATLSEIIENQGKQSFFIALSCKQEMFDFSTLKISYTTDDGYEFMQVITIWLEDKTYFYSSSLLTELLSVSN